MLELEDYYKTDTHWKQERLLKVAKTIAESMNVNLENEYKEKTICDFQGTYSGQLPISTAKDKIKILTNSEIEKSKVYNYASSLVSLFIPKYSKITLIDTRYISPKLLPNYVKLNNQDILFMYSTLVINNSYSLK